MPRAHRSLLVLTVVTVLATGLASQALGGPAGVGSDIQLGASLALLAVSTTLLLRVVRAIWSPRNSQSRLGDPAGRQRDAR